MPELSLSGSPYSFNWREGHSNRYTCGKDVRDHHVHHSYFTGKDSPALLKLCPTEQGLYPNFPVLFLVQPPSVEIWQFAETSGVGGVSKLEGKSGGGGGGGGTGSHDHKA